jgi:hypothetical protein
MRSLTTLVLVASACGPIRGTARATQAAMTASTAVTIAMRTVVTMDRLDPTEDRQGSTADRLDLTLAQRRPIR